MKTKNERFIIIQEDKQSFAVSTRILKDKQTGVLYMFHSEGYAGGLTVLVDKDGKPLVDHTNHNFN